MFGPFLIQTKKKKKRSKRQINSKIEKECINSCFISHFWVWSPKRKYPSIDSDWDSDALQSILSSRGCSEMAVTEACAAWDPLCLSPPLCRAIHLSVDTIISFCNSLFVYTADVRYLCKVIAMTRSLRNPTWRYVVLRVICAKADKMSATKGHPSSPCKKWNIFLILLTNLQHGRGD